MTQSKYLVHIYLYLSTSGDTRLQTPSNAARQYSLCEIGKQGSYTVQLPPLSSQEVYLAVESC
jgi:hypothetical protein